MNRPLLRAFVALPLAASMQDRIARETRFLREQGWSVKWVEPRNMHLTLKFLGDVADDQVVALTRSLTRVGKAHSVIAATIGGLGAFPDIRRARTLWIGFEQGNDLLAKLGDAIEVTCGELGYRRERRPFFPHITLGRVRGPHDARSIAAVLPEYSKISFGPIEFGEIVLLSSQLSPLGPEYSRLATLPLA